MVIYDYLIVGSGLYGATCAFELHKRGYKVLVLEKRNHLGGNVFTEAIDDINVHKYGAHIFHTSNKMIWEYINRFADFNNFINSPIAIYKNEVYNLPFNMNTFTKLWRDVVTPEDAKRKIEQEISKHFTSEPKNLEEQAINLVGTTIYEKLIKEYSEKQWGRSCRELPSFIIKRLPVRFVFDNNYFNDCYQGIPIGGYTKIIENMLDGIEVRMNTNFLNERNHFLGVAKTIIYTGSIDEYYEYCYGKLEYRSLSFVHKRINIVNYQGNAVINYTSKNHEFTRIIEHKHFEFGEQPTTVISEEYPLEWTEGIEPYYPVNDAKNNSLYSKYNDKASNDNEVIFGGRLGLYRYFDMDDTISEALALVKQIEESNND